MADADPQATQRDVLADIPAQLCIAGFDDVVEIGRGGFGMVYRCLQPLLDREVAIKVLTADLDPENLDRFLREQRVMGRLSGHPHIATIFQVGTTPGGRPYIVMPCHNKGSLEALIRRHGPTGWSETLSIGVKLAGALEAANRAGILELTPQEHQIAQLARTRRTNPEIGAELFPSARTVEWHLPNVFAKLGISSRHELDAVFDRRSHARTTADPLDSLPCSGQYAGCSGHRLGLRTKIIRHRYWLGPLPVLAAVKVRETNQCMLRWYSPTSIRDPGAAGGNSEILRRGSDGTY